MRNDNANDPSQPAAADGGRRGSLILIGGGVIGLAAARYLVRDGWSVTVIDRGRIGGACSHGNCGLVCPSHVLPLAEPGAIGNAWRALFHRNDPFRIRPRFDPALWRWLWQFARRCNRRDMLAAAVGIQALLRSSMEEYHQLVERENVECEWQERGLLFVYQSERAWRAYEATNRLLAENFQEPAEQLDARATLALEPALKQSIAGSWYYKHDAHLRPDVLLSSLRRDLEEQGVSFLEACQFQRLKGTGTEATRIQTSCGELRADGFIFATGAWSPRLNEQLGVRIPIEPGKGYSLTMPRPARCPQIPIIFPEQRVAVTPMRSGYRLGSIMEFVGYDETIHPERLELLRAAARRYLHEPLAEPELESWFGWRPMTHDSLPIIDRAGRWQNVWLATGHNMLGLSMAPGTGRLLTEMIGEHAPHVDPAPYRLSRFAARRRA